MKKHVREVHPGLGYKCPRPNCGRILSRPMTHHPCQARPMELFLYHRLTGAKGENVKEMYKKWEEEELPELWKEHFKSPFQCPNPITPLPVDRPPRRPSPLERCYKRPATPASYDDLPKRRKPSTLSILPEEELDLQHDPVPISLELPPGFEVLSNPSGPCWCHL